MAADAVCVALIEEYVDQPIRFAIPL